MSLRGTMPNCFVNWRKKSYIFPPKFFRIWQISKNLASYEAMPNLRDMQRLTRVRLLFLRVYTYVYTDVCTHESQRHYAVRITDEENCS